MVSLPSLSLRQFLIIIHLLRFGYDHTVHGGGFNQRKTKSNFFSHQSSTSKHRLQVLNKVFLQTITEIMAFGEVADKLQGQQLHITKVRYSMNDNCHISC